MSSSLIRFDALFQVRSTSHKPDEIYGMIERLSPGTRKIELFGRPHNVQPNWYDKCIFYLLIIYSLKRGYKL